MRRENSQQNTFKQYTKSVSVKKPKTVVLDLLSARCFYIQISTKQRNWTYPTDSPLINTLNHQLS